MYVCSMWLECMSRTAYVNHLQPLKHNQDKKEPTANKTTTLNWTPQWSGGRMVEYFHSSEV